MTGHLIACTITALIALLLAWSLRRRSAGLRYSILLAAVLAFAAPTPLFTRAAEALPPVVMPPLRWIPSIPAGIPLARNPLPAWHIAEIAAWIWLAVFTILLASWLRRTLRRVTPVRAAGALETGALESARTRLRLHRNVGLCIAAPHCGPGAQGWLRPRVVLPEGLSAQLSASELDAILAHELAHIARHDNLSAAFVRIVASAFWFHPLLWWLERRMLAEREAACDEMVLAHGADPAAYAAAIAKVCRMSFTGSEAYAGATGANFKQRMEYIMSAHTVRPASRFLRAIPAVILALGVAGSYIRAQSPAEDLRGLAGTIETLMSQHREGDAIALVQSEIDKDPGRLDLGIALGNLYVRTEQYNQAIAVFQALLDVHSDGKEAASLHFRLGETYRRMGQTAKALHEFEAASADDPGSVQPLLARALLFDAQGNRPEAGALYERVLQLQPGHAVALNNLAYLKSEAGGNLDDALSMALKAHQKQPDSSNIDDTVAWIYLKMKRPGDAEGWLRDALKAEPNNASFHYHLGAALLQGGDRADAMREFQTALDDGPSAQDKADLEKLKKQTVP